MMVPAIEAEITKRKWISEDEMPDIVAISQSAPGLLTVNMAIFCGWKLRGLAGSVVATAGCLIAPFFIILLIAMSFTSFKDNPLIAKIFCGVRPAAVAIIAAYAVKLCRRNGSRWWQWAITLGTFSLIVFFKTSAVSILLTVIVLAAAVAHCTERGRDRQ